MSEGFIRINNTLINANRLLAMERQPEKKDGRCSQVEHYLAVFDTGQKLMLTPEEGSALMDRLLSPVTEQTVSG